MSDQNWRVDTDAEDYFTHQQKKVNLADRRPAQRASDLVGPGINSTAVRITDYNNLLATFNGYYSAAAGALNAPDFGQPNQEAFLGHVVSDTDLGGLQTFTGLRTGTEYTRTFSRSPISEETLDWGAWRGQRIPPSAQGDFINITEVSTGAIATLVAPAIDTIGAPTYERSSGGIRLLQPGVYTGFVEVGSTSLGASAVYVKFTQPRKDAPFTSTHLNVPLGGPTLLIPFTVWATDELQSFSLTMRQTAVPIMECWYRFSCTRVGDSL